MEKMTTEEAKKVLNTLENETLCCVCPFDIEECNDCENCIVNVALQMAIKALEEIDGAIENWYSISRLALALKMSLKEERHKLDKIASEIEEQVKLVESMGCSAKQFRVAWGIVNQYRCEQNEM